MSLPGLNQLGLMCLAPGKNAVRLEPVAKGYQQTTLVGKELICSGLTSDITCGKPNQM